MDSITAIIQIPNGTKGLIIGRHGKTVKDIQSKTNTLIRLRHGKTTWAKKQNLPIVNRDSIRLALHGQRFVPEAEEMVSAIESIMVKSLFLSGHNTIIIDATHLTAKRRDRWLSDQWDIELKIIPTFIF